ncbi:histidine kinase [Mahella australiensis 50-1 BON]|uniref:Histidine kinase n=2 Tax=Mahella TaxID=252965 RepID=F4A119_MAHA5|nr:histidine kinase [Mahella australiensis 50-1 BON]
MILLVLPLIGLSVGVYNYYNNLMKDEISAANTSALSRVKDMVDMVAAETDKLSIRIASDSDVEVFLLSAKPGILDYDNMSRIANIQRAIGVSTITSDYIDSIYVYSEENNYIITSTRSTGQLSSFADVEWLNFYQEQKPKANAWIEPRSVKWPLDSNVSYFISSFRLAPLYHQRKAGAVVINIDVNKLARLINNASRGRFENIFIVDKYGRILYNADTSLINKSMSYIEYLKGFSPDPGTDPLIRDIGGVKSIISFVKSGYNDWSYISVIPLVQYEQKTAYLRQFMIVSIAVSVIIALVLAFLISMRVFQPIGNIIDIIENPEQWLKTNKLNDKNKLNEFKYIASNIIKYFDRDRQMEEELAYRTSLLRKAQVAALQSQINPHFLYNTLETINWMAIDLGKGENKVSDMISSLSELLRISLETEDNLIPLHVELKHVHLYVEIQKIRYEDKFDVIWDIDESILDYKIIKITLQPLIENAIYHGIKPKKGRGIIKVRGYMQEPNIVLEIIDDGVGMSPEEMESINREMAYQYTKEEQHIGIRNVNQRIKLLFGSEYGLTVENGIGNGTEVKILIPMVK